MRTELTSGLIITVGTLSLLSLLVLLRERFPHLFALEGRRMRRLIEKQDLLGKRIGELESQEPSAQLLRSIDEARVRRANARLSMRKRLKYGRWKIPVPVYWGFACAISALLFSLSLELNYAVQAASLFGGPVIMMSLLSRSIDRRFKRFDTDYPQFLMSVVGLLKTGATPIGAIETASRSLDPGSLVRQEVQLMGERLRVGVLEDKSIGGFGEDIYHPEIELFTEALLLNHRMGGNLSGTLERLARQVRKRQFFRSSAEAAIGLQRGSLWMIMAILAGLQVFLAIMHPALVFRALETPLGQQVWQIAALLTLFAIYWIRQITRMKI